MKKTVTLLSVFAIACTLYSPLLAQFVSSPQVWEDRIGTTGSEVWWSFNTITFNPNQTWDFSSLQNLQVEETTNIDVVTASTALGASNFPGTTFALVPQPQEEGESANLAAFFSVDQLGIREHGYFFVFEVPGVIREETIERSSLNAPVLLFEPIDEAVTYTDTLRTFDEDNNLEDQTIVTRTFRYVGHQNLIWTDQQTYPASLWEIEEREVYTDDEGQTEEDHFIDYIIVFEEGEISLDFDVDPTTGAPRRLTDQGLPLDEFYATTYTTTSTSIDQDEQLVRQLELHGNYPNPFNPSTTIAFSVAQAAPVELVVYNLLGQAVWSSGQRTYSAGTHQLRFDASALHGGLYLYRITSGATSRTGKMTLLK